MKRQVSSRSAHPDSPASGVAPADGAAPGISNPRLLEAIHRYREARALETATLLFDELRTATFLAAIPRRRSPVQRAAQATVSAPEAVPLLEVREEGERLLAVFTDPVAMKSSVPRGSRALVISARGAMARVLGDGYAGMVIDPRAEHRLRLDALFVRNVLPRM